MRHGYWYDTHRHFLMQGILNCIPRTKVAEFCNRTHSGHSADLFQFAAIKDRPKVNVVIREIRLKNTNCNSQLQKNICGTT
jgi:hypothetical protein